MIKLMSRSALSL
jgi:hypothetical protein